MQKPRVILDLPEVNDFEPRASRPSETSALAHSAGQDAGFTTRHAPEIMTQPKTSLPPSGFDARSLRRSNRTAQLGIAVSPENKDRFWRVAQRLGVQSGEEVLVALLNAMDKHGATQ